MSLPDQALLFNLDTILAKFQTLSDQRSRRAIRHPLATTLFIRLLGLLAGQHCPTALAAWSKLRAKALGQLLGLPRDRVRLRSTFERILGQAVAVSALDALIGGLFQSTLSTAHHNRGMELQQLNIIPFL